MMKSLLLCVLFALVSVSLARIVYVGTNQDIRVYLQQTNGTLSLLQSVALNAPSAYLAVHPNGKFLYATGAGLYLSYSIKSDGTLAALNQISSFGDDPCHLVVHPRGGFLLGASYGSGSFVTYSLQSDGLIAAHIDSQIPGKGILVNADRQDGRHAHQILVTPNETLVVGADLGADKFFVWHLDLSSGKLTPNEVPYGQVASGSGNRHLAFHPNGKYTYVASELASTVDLFIFDPVRGSFTSVQSISTLPETFTGSNTVAEIRVSPSGSHVYVTNRGHDSVAVFRIFANGRLAPVQTISSQGATPRGLNIDPTGKFLYVGNQDGNNVVFYTVDNLGLLNYVEKYPATGALDVQFSLA